MAKESLPSAFDRFAPVLLVAVIGMAFAIGALWQKVSILEKGGSAVVSGDNVAQGAEQPTLDGKLTEEEAKKIPEITDKDRIRGSKNAKVYLVEYSDLECPFCKQFHKTAQQAVDEYKGEVAWVYRHYPLDSLHPQAREEALATECAAEQKGTDGFWALTDKIYEVTPSNNGLNLADLPKLAGQVGLDGTKLQTCIDSGKYKDIVEAQYQGGVTAGVTGTPGNFVINDKGEAWLIPGAVPFTTLKQTLDEALGKS